MPIRPAPVIALDAYTCVEHVAPGREDYFGETPSSVEHLQLTCGPQRQRGRGRTLHFWLQGDWT